MKKSLLFFTSVCFVVVFLVGTAQAAMVDVSASPETIDPGDTTTITILCDEDATGAVTVITPLGTPSSVIITLTANVPKSLKYPTDFLGASTTELGEYEVILYLKGKTWRAAFWVSFFVIPEVPFGTIIATISSFGAVFGVATIKRARRY